jgi:hypothetical protein
MVKHCLHELLVPLLHITNLSLRYGCFPTKLKTSKVIPLHKKGNKHEVENFRPISLVSTFSKIIEKVVLTRILNHLERNNITLKNQHGFQKKKSTLTALVDMVEEMTDRLEKGESIVGIYLDLSKAFDCLSHDLILDKLQLLGFQNTAWQWFASYLRGRQQLVELRQKVNGTCTSIRSSLLPVSRGVPQGSVLGPVIFILFTQDLPSYTEGYSKAIMYADDTVLISSSKSTEELEISSLISLSRAVEYCTMNDLVFNEAKTRQLNMGINREEISEFPNLQCVDLIKHLGMTLDVNLAWDGHVDSLCKKLSCGIFALRRIKTVSTTEAVKTAYYALLDSHIRYGVALWGATTQKNLKRVLVLQKKAIRVMADLGWRESCRRAFVEWEILTVVNTYILEAVTMACSINPPRHEEVHNHNTRRAHDFNLPVHSSKRFEKKPSYYGAKLYNHLPSEIKRSSPEKLKSQLNKWLLQHPFYCMEEFFNWRNPRH